MPQRGHLQQSWCAACWIQHRLPADSHLPLNLNPPDKAIWGHSRSLLYATNTVGCRAQVWCMYCRLSLG